MVKDRKGAQGIRSRNLEKSDAHPPIRIEKAPLIKELPDSERPRERLARQGEKSLTNAELLAVLIGSGTRDHSAVMLASRLLAMDERGLLYLSECTLEDLKEVKGIGSAKASRILCAIELGRRLSSQPRGKTVSVGSPADVSQLFMEEMRHLKKEHFKVLLLNTKNEIITIDEVSVGNLNSAIVHPREVFVKAVKKSASSVILVHNHPSGNPQPSREDTDLTARLVESGRILGIEVLDHIVIGDGVFVSFKDKMLM